MTRDQGTSESVSASEQRILNSLAWWGSAGVTMPTRRQVAFGARYTVNGRFNNLVGQMRSKGLIEYPKGDCIAWTEEGAALAAIPMEAPTRAALVEMVGAVLKPSDQRVVYQVDQLGTPSREELATASNYTVNGRFNNILGKLRSLGVITYPKGNHVALSEIFDAF